MLLHVLAPSPGGAVSLDASDRANRALAELIPADLACQCACTTRVAKGNIAIEILAEASHRRTPASSSSAPPIVRR